MNIFVLDNDPALAASNLCDKHLSKMCLESAQMLCSAYKNYVGVPYISPPYKITHYNHPCSVWTRESAENFDWLVSHGLAIADEFERTYGNMHKSRKVIQWAWTRKSQITFPTVGLTPFAQAMPEHYKHPDAVIAYRTYYLEEKASIAQWNHGRSKPNWWTK